MIGSIFFEVHLGTYNFELVFKKDLTVEIIVRITIKRKNPIEIIGKLRFLDFDVSKLQSKFDGFIYY